MTLLTNRLWTFGGAKGGTGKSFLTASVALVLARMGRSVVAVDASLGNPGLHAFFGLRSPFPTLHEVLDGQAAVESALHETALPRVRLLSCTDDSSGMADTSRETAVRMLEVLSSLDADHVLLDLGSTMSATTLDFSNAGSQSVVLTSPEPASMQSAFAWIRNALLRRLDSECGVPEILRRNLGQAQRQRSAHQPSMLEICDTLAATEPALAGKLKEAASRIRPVLVLNMARTEQDRRTAVLLQSAVRQILGLEIRLAGIVPADTGAGQAVQQMKLPDLDYAGSPALYQIREMVRNLINGQRQAETGCADPKPKAARPVTTQGLNDNLDFLGRQLHVQTEDLGRAKRVITTQVFLNGKVIHSMRSAYPDAPGGDSAHTKITEMMRAQHLAVLDEIRSQRVRFVSP